MKNELNYSEDGATVLFHTFTMSMFLMCIFGGIISDVWLGKYNTILILSIVYAFGSSVVAISAIPTMDISPRATLIAGLLLIAVGCGGIKPCVSAFGGDQFKLPEQAHHIEIFFSVFYFTLNFGSVISVFLIPILKSEVHCFERDDCFFLAFGFPVILMVAFIGK